MKIIRVNPQKEKVVTATHYWKKLSLDCLKLFIVGFVVTDMGLKRSLRLGCGYMLLRRLLGMYRFRGRRR